jgi:hypothetical protein
MNMDDEDDMVMDDAAVLVYALHVGEGDDAGEDVGEDAGEARDAGLEG